MDDSKETLDNLQRGIDEAKSHLKSGGLDHDDAKQGMGKAMGFAGDLIAGVAVGGFLGYAIDRFFGTSPWFFIVCFFLGFAAGVKNMLREFNKRNGQ